MSMVTYAFLALALVLLSFNKIKTAYLFFIISVFFAYYFKIINITFIVINIIAFGLALYYRYKKSLILELILFVFCIGLFLGACGYVPTSKIANNIFDEKVYVNVELSQQDPKNSIYVADTLKEMVISKLGRKLALKHEADDVINVKMNNLEFIPLAYDKNGYVISYKAKLNLDFNVVFKDGSSQAFSTSGSYNFEISPNSIISDSARYEAIRAASSEAFDEFISVIAIKGQKRDSKY